MAPCGSEEALQNLLDTPRMLFLTAFFLGTLLSFFPFFFSIFDIYKCVRTTSVSPYARERADRGQVVSD